MPSLLDFLDHRDGLEGTGVGGDAAALAEEIIEIIRKLRQLSGNAKLDFLSSLKDNKLLRELLWKTFVRDTVFAQWLNAPNVESSPYFVPVSIACIAGVFIAGGIIEFIRMYLLEPLYLKYIKKLGKKLDDKVNKYITKEGVPGNITQVS